MHRSSPEPVVSLPQLLSRENIIFTYMYGILGLVVTTLGLRARADFSKIDGRMKVSYIVAS